MFNLAFLTTLRADELETVAGLLDPQTRLLEIGAGMGWQARELTARGHDVAAVDLPASDYEAHRVFPVTDYNGVELPFPNAAFDVVFTSNVLEHVEQLEALQAEIHRVLRPQGRCIHILPTATWRLWTSLAAFPNFVVVLLLELVRPGRTGALRRIAVAAGLAIAQPAHGAGPHAITELQTFRPAAWRRRFLQQGFDIERDWPLGLFYTGFFLFGAGLSLARRRKLARLLGSSCHAYLLKSAAR
jgi:SAM-dependent methyltransferase